MKVGLIVPKRIWHAVPSAAFVGLRSLEVKDAPAVQDPAVQVSLDVEDHRAFLDALGTAEAACRVVANLTWSAIGSSAGGSNGS